VTRLAYSPAIESQQMRFLDNPEGGVRVESADGRVIASFGIGEGGFLRGVLRGFARDRRSRDMGSQEAFTLTRHQDGRLSLADSASGRVVELDAFGPTNAGLFGRLLIEGRSFR
jgi:putative photosynthetic complex assembly protein